MTRRSLLALFAVGPFARRRPTPTPAAPPPTIGESPTETVRRTIARLDMIEVTCFGDRKVYVPRITR